MLIVGVDVFEEIFEVMVGIGGGGYCGGGGGGWSGF